MNALRQANDRLDSSVSGFIRRLQVERGAGRMIVLLILSFGLFAILRPNVFLSLDNLQNLGMATPEIGILALAMSVAMLTGGIDLSVVGIMDAATISMSMTYDALHQSMGAGADNMWPLLIVLALAVGLLAGFINGLLIAYTGITPILATLGTMQIFNGLGIVATGGRVLYSYPPALANLGQIAIAGVPFIFFIFVVVAVIIGIVINRTATGRRITLQGANAVASRYSGINSRRALMTTYVTTGLLAGVAAVVVVMRNPIASADYGTSYTLLVIVIAVLGGTNPNGGFATVLGVVFAALTLQIVSSGFTVMRLSQYLYTIAQGAILVIIMIIDQLDFGRLWKQRRLTQGKPPVDNAASPLQQAAQ